MPTAELVFESMIAEQIGTHCCGVGTVLNFPWLRRKITQNREDLAREIKQKGIAEAA